MRTTAPTTASRVPSIPACLPPIRHYARLRRTPAFTLIELLTVITIIGILAAILIPVVGKVRENAKRSQNAAKLRTIGLACHTYANDNKGLMPQVLRGANGPQMTQGPVLYVASRGNLLSLLTNKWGDSGAAWGSVDYLPGPDAFYSPFTPNMQRQPGRFMPYTAPGSYIMSYIYYSLPAEDNSSPKRNPLAPNLFNDRVDRGSYIRRTPLLSDPTTQNWGDLAGGFTGSKIGCVHLDASVSLFDRDYIYSLGSNDKIKAMAGVLQ